MERLPKSLNINLDQTPSSISSSISLDRFKQIFGQRRGLAILVLIQPGQSSNSMSITKFNISTLMTERGSDGNGRQFTCMGSVLIFRVIARRHAIRVQHAPCFSQTSSKLSLFARGSFLAWRSRTELDFKSDEVVESGLVNISPPPFFSFFFSLFFFLPALTRYVTELCFHG